MSQYNKEELNLVIQAVIPLFIVAGLVIFLISSSGGFAWFMLLGVSFGLSIIILTWIGKKSSYFCSFSIDSGVSFYSTYDLKKR